MLAMIATFFMTPFELHLTSDDIWLDLDFGRD